GRGAVEPVTWPRRVESSPVTSPIADSGATTAKGTGVGTEYHVAEPTLVGQALVDDSGELMHAFAYAEA
ncbi:MAG: hypothetical protein RLZZ93_843, partial [Actinomycetota bacterium]